MLLKWLAVPIAFPTSQNHWKNHHENTKSSIKPTNNKNESTDGWLPIRVSQNAMLTWITIGYRKEVHKEERGHTATKFEVKCDNGHI